MEQSHSAVQEQAVTTLPAQDEPLAVVATSRSDAKGLTDRQTLQAVLSKPENRYLARQMCWVMSIEGLETYILVPRDLSDISLLVDALRTTPQPWDLDVVIGRKDPSLRL